MVRADSNIYNSKKSIKQSVTCNQHSIKANDHVLDDKDYRSVHVLLRRRSFI